MTTQNRIPSLDGLRAVSIGLVLACHAAQMPAAAGLPVPLARVFAVSGELGVRVFFVISGFLITSLLLKEMDASGSIDLKHFFFRRTLRIFPAFYVYVGTVALLLWVGVVTIPTYLLPAVTYTTDYFHPGEGLTGHAWSLAVEEQFYLLWPFALAALGRGRGLKAAALVILVAPAARVTLYAVTRDHTAVGCHFEAVADSLAVGCVLAGLRGRLHTSSLYQRALRSRLCALAPLAVLALQYALAHRTRWGFLAHILVGVSLSNILIVICVDRAVTLPGRVLNCPPLAFVGVLSYSLYLWQQLFLNYASPFSVAAGIAATCLCAALSYYAVERPFFALRRWLEPRLFGKAPASSLDTPRCAVTTPG